MHLFLVEDVLSVGMPESGGADAGVGKMAAAQGSHAWPRPCPRGRCWAPHMCIVGQSVTVVCLKAAVTTLVYLELCFLNSFCFVIFYFILFFYYHRLAY